MWFSHFVPYPPIGGAFQRSYNLLKSTALDNDVYLIALKAKETSHPLEEQEKAAEELGKICRKVFIIKLPSSSHPARLFFTVLKSLLSSHSLALDLYESAEARKLSASLNTEITFDLAYFDAISVAGYHREFTTPVKVLNHHNAESVMLQRRIKREKNLLKKIFFAFEAIKLRRDEIHYCPQFSVNTTVSELDRQFLQNDSPQASFTVIENGVDTDFFYHIPFNSAKRSLIFAGRQDQYANRDGIAWFCAEVWPLIKSRYSDMTLMIVGSGIPESLQKTAAADDRIELLGYVDDVRTCFEKAVICVIPLRDGGGTRLKVLDAMAMGPPIVATTMAIEGLEITPGKEVLTADTPQQFLDHITTILDHKETAISLTTNARTTVEEKYSWHGIGRKLNRVFAQLSSSPNMTPNRTGSHD
jgi:polysaccharide biosynthesis protein PslH